MSWHNSPKNIFVFISHHGSFFFPHHNSIFLLLFFFFFCGWGVKGALGRVSSGELGLEFQVPLASASASVDPRPELAPLWPANYWSRKAEGLKEHIRPIWGFSWCVNMRIKETLMLYVIPLPSLPFSTSVGRLSPGWQQAPRLQNDSRLLIYSKLISPLIRALVNLRARKLQRSWSKGSDGWKKSRRKRGSSTNSERISRGENQRDLLNLEEEKTNRRYV